MNILVVAAHPDDEALGCGGTIAKYSKEHNIYCLFLGDGVTSRDTVNPSEVEQRMKMANDASKFLGIKCLDFHQLPDNQFDAVPLLSIAKLIEESIRKYEPDIIFTHSGSDLNIDHTLTYRATLTAARPLPGSNIRAIYSYEIPSSTEWSFGASGFRPTAFSDITNTLHIKLLALQEYKKELRDFPHPRSSEIIINKSTVWGSVIGYPFSEAFEIVWEKLDIL